MKQLRTVPVCLLGLFLLMATILPAQYSTMAYASREVGFRAPGSEEGAKSFKDRLWYGGGLTLGFSGSDQSSVFAFGVSPMVGYKVIEQISIGPRVSALFTSQKYRGFNSFSLFDLELGLFARIRVYQGFFVQGEVAYISDQYIFQTQSFVLEKATRSRSAEYLGIGYNFANGQGGWGQEIAIMYDFFIANDINAYENPWQYRFVFTYGF
ncbi:MAG: hypothetical protein ACKVU2_10625 [Saprospiraceae bacterium]